MIWPRICPVCRLELPERGNRRVYVPWKRGYRLVHAGECFQAIDAQGVLAVTAVNEKPQLLDSVTLVRARARVEALLARHEPLKHTTEDLAAIACERVARFQKQLIRDQGPDELERLHQHAAQLVNRFLAHAREVSGQARTEAILG